MPADQQFLEYIIKSLVDNPDDVKITRTVDEMGVLMTLDINPADMGKVIGRNGNTARAIRSLLKVIGLKNNARVNLKINEPGGYRAPRMERSESSEMAETDDDSAAYDSDDSEAQVEDDGMQMGGTY